MIRKLAILPEHTDVYRHLAAEELLMTELAPDTAILYLWRSEDCVVIGKNQNPWLECELKAMATDHVHMARRLSGGGAVYHDLGNLNFTFIVHQDQYHRDEIAQTVLSAVHRTGINATLGPRHILEVDGRKFSGNAFCIKRRKVIHHGTLLLSADLDRLQRYLLPTCKGIETKSIRSVPSPVVNLREHKSSLTIERLKEHIVEEFAPDEILKEPITSGNLDEVAEVYRSTDWLFLRTPRFAINGSATFESRPIKFSAKVVNGLIESLDTEPELEDFAKTFEGEPFSGFLAKIKDLEIT